MGDAECCVFCFRSNKEVACLKCEISELRSQLVDKDKQLEQLQMLIDIIDEMHPAEMITARYVIEVINEPNTN